MLGISLNNRQPIYEQLICGIEKLVLNGIIEPDSPLPSVRELAAELAVNPNTIQRAYTELERAGIAYSVSGKGIYVTDDVEAVKRARIREYLSDIKENAITLARLDVSVKTVAAEVEEAYKEVGK